MRNQSEFNPKMLYQFHYFNLSPANPKALTARSMPKRVIERERGAKCIQTLRHDVVHGQENLKLAVETKKRL